MISSYANKVTDTLDTVFTTQEDKLKLCAEKIYQAFAGNGILHLFGTGHSHLLAEEMFYRAGGPAPVNAILEPAFMLHEAPELGTKLERTEGLAPYIFRRHDIRPADIMMVFTNSGRNAVPNEMALLAKQRGLFTIGLGSTAYRDVTSRMESGKKLVDIVDVFLDNGSELGDACVALPGTDRRVGSTSTIAGAAMVNAIGVEVAFLLAARGKMVPYFISANGIENSDAHNAELMRRYRGRVKLY